MFDVGFAEILLLSLVGLLVLGPERLPRVARTLGGLARKARSSWLNLRRSIEAEMRAEELKEPLKHFQDEINAGVNSIKNFNPADPDSAEKPDGEDAETRDGSDSADRS